jgi:Methylamine utilisation protein MauE
MYPLLLKHAPKLIGYIFLFAGGYKLLLPGQATMALESLGLPYTLANTMVIGATILELYLAALLIRQIDLKYALVVSTALMLAFTVYMWYLSSLAHPPSCGCLGLTGIFKSRKQEALFGLFRNCVILWLLKLTYDYHFPRQPVQPMAKPEPHLSAAR